MPNRMVCHFLSYDGKEVAFMTKFLENTRCGATTSKSEIDHVGKVHGDAQTIDHDKHPFCHTLPGSALFVVQWQEEEQRI